MNKKLERWLQTIVLLLFGIGIIGWLIWTIYSAFYIPDKPTKPITFEITGITNSENASTLVQIHFECMKYCTTRYSSDYVKSCWDQCALLGKESCNGK